MEGLSGVWGAPLQDEAVKAAQEAGESEAAGHAAAVLLRPLRQLLGQLGAGTQHGQRGGRQVVLLQQSPAALHALCSEREPKQEALYGRTDAGSCMEKHQRENSQPELSDIYHPERETTGNTNID